MELLMQKHIKRRNRDTPLMIMLCGLPASGKSTYSEHIVVSKDDKLSKPSIHSSDKLREELYGNEEIQGDNNKLFNELHKRIKRDLIAGKDVIYDATNINKKYRKNFLNELKNIKCTPICLCLMTPYDMCLLNNEKRERKVPVNVIRKMYINWQPPHYSEGFEEIKFLFLGLKEEHKKNYSIKKFFEIADKFDQENSHHTLSLGEHCKKATVYMQNVNVDNFNLLLATMLHDNGKLHTKTYTNAKGVEDGECHYYQHHCCGAYESLFYMYYINKMHICSDISDKLIDGMVYVSNLIYYHMHPYNQWEQSEKSKRRDRELLGEELFDDIMLLHDADVYAH